jgi:hypothetical protein
VLAEFPFSDFGHLPFDTRCGTPLNPYWRDWMKKEVWVKRTIDACNAGCASLLFSFTTLLCVEKKKPPVSARRQAATHRRVILPAHRLRADRDYIAIITQTWPS